MANESTESIKKEVESVVNEAVDKIYRGKKSWMSCTRNLHPGNRSSSLCVYPAATPWTGKEWGNRGMLSPTSYL